MELRRLNPGTLVEVVVLQTMGDKVLDSPLSQIGGKGVFTKEIEEALLDGRIDVAVHSLKDLPTTHPDGLDLAAITKRENPHDLLLSREGIDLATAPLGLRVGTSSLRRRAQLLRLNPSLDVQELRGNVPTRIRRMVEGSFDAIVLAAAGLSRLGEKAPHILELPCELMMPAPGQGALGIQIRTDDDEVRAAARKLTDPESTACCTAERTVLRAVEGGCQVPLGALAEIHGDRLVLKARVISLDGRRSVEGEMSGNVDDAEQIGGALAEDMLERGAEEILRRIRDESGSMKGTTPIPVAAEIRRPLAGKNILITRDEDADGPLSVLVRHAGANPVLMRLLRHVPVEDEAPLREILGGIDRYQWLIVTSARTLEFMAATMKGKPFALEQFKGQIGAVGDRTAHCLESLYGRVADLVSTEGTGMSLLEALQLAGVGEGDRVLYPCSDLTQAHLADGLRRLGAEVDQVTCYRTVTARADMAPLPEGIRPDVVLLCSSSAVQAFFERLNPAECMILHPTMQFASIGPKTSEALMSLGYRVDVEATDHSFEGLVVAVERHLAER